MQVCHAVQHAHQKGVIHRDLKPSNILVTVKDDQPVPKVIDSGIAKATLAQLTEETIFTRFHQWIGPPAYMSPEQAGLGSLDVDTRSDVYSLGVLLYELLTGRPPFDPQKLLAVGYDAVMRTIREEEPPKPSTRLSALKADELSQVATHRHADPAKLERAVKGDLDRIVMKALEKNRTRRYDTANALARDLEHHVSNEPVSAVAPTFGYRLQKNQALGNGRIIRARELLEAYIPRRGQIDRRGLEWRHLWGRCRGEQLTAILAANGTPIRGLGITPDDAFLVAADAAGLLCVIRLENFNVVCTTNALESGGAAALSISSDGKRLAVSGSGSGSVCIRELFSDGTLALLRRVKAASPFGLAFSPDGRRLAVAMRSGKVQILEPPSPDSILTLQSRGDVAEGAAFSSSGNMLAVSGWKTVSVWSLPSGKELACFPDGGHPVYFSADGKTLISFGSPTKLWHTSTKRELFTMSAPRILIPLTGEVYANTVRMDAGGPQVWEVSKLPPLAGAEEWLRAQPASLAEVRQLLYAIPPRDSKAASTLIPLDRYYRAGFDRAWSAGMTGNDLGPLPRGVQVFNSTAFDIRGLVLPDKAGRNVIQVGQACQRLRFLHNATGQGIKSGVRVGRYKIRYADGQTAEVPLFTGRNIQDWWADPASLDASGEAAVAWVGTNAPSRKGNHTIHLLTLTWPNPRPAVPIQTVTLEQIGNVAEPFLVAVAAE
jgi:hypothetical protein